MEVDLIISNAKVYTVNENFDILESFAVKDGRIVEVGSSKLIRKKYKSKNTIDAKGKTIMPGFIDAHCHFYGYGKNMRELSLYNTKSFDEIIKIIKNSKIKERWIIGRGWDQNDWKEKQFPDKKKLDILFPNTPIFLTRIDGHAALVNQKALDLAEINASTKVKGGKILKEKGELTGMLIDKAMNLVQNKIPKIDKKEIKEALKKAELDCFKNGLTTVSDAGLSKKIINIINEMHQENELKIRVYCMVSDDKENLNYFLEKGPLKTDRINVTSVKSFSDGALGSRGACLIQPYTDENTNYGLFFKNENYFLSLAEKCYENNFQLNIHCIGDSATRIILQVYSKILEKNNDRRWRIEHCQVVNEKDFKKFKEYKIIPSVQPTHATSDMPWAIKRLGKKRLKYSYANKMLLEYAGTIALGTDFPIEKINPILTFYAATIRKDSKGFPNKGFQTENALSKEETLKGMTIWAAYANFEEKEKGSIEKDKVADFVILNQNIMEVEDSLILKTKVLETFVNGEKVF
tara:strand:- start:39 stop:1598 length:1560 start_codon:yes stop_codon:yes gene_type:complete